MITENLQDMLPEEDQDADHNRVPAAELCHRAIATTDSTLRHLELVDSSHK
jgi:hypothetical protein